MTDTYSCGITMHRPTANLYSLLNLERWASSLEIQESIKGLELTADQRYAWKALSDPAYRVVYDRRRDTSDLYEAGFFDDGLPKLPHQYKSWNVALATTNLNKVRENIQKLDGTAKLGNNLVVLVTTGGMAPIHSGHIAMMEEAKREIESNGGITVVGGFFSPGHDSYVGQKYNGSAAIPAVDRCAMVELATQNSGWLELDPWAARYMPSEINFTEVYRRLASYLRNNLDQVVHLVYVFGSDNQGFEKAPIDSIMVERSEVSSKAVREGEHHHLDPLVYQYFNTYKAAHTNQLPYLIRNEEDEAISQWQHTMPGGLEELTRRRIQLQSTIRLAIAQAFKVSGQDHKVYLLTVSDQRAKALKVIGDRKTISLDPFFKGDERLDSTRYFAASGQQTSPLYRDSRLGFNSLDVQAGRILPGDYVLVEDDSVTGETIASARMRLPSNVNITDVILLSDFASYPDDEYYDVVDLRDFIVGSNQGGLSVVLANGLKARVPYALPYVSLRARAKIPASMELEISRIIWQANVRFFANSNIRIRDANGLVSLALNAKWHLDVLLEDFCQWHVDALLENA